VKPLVVTPERRITLPGALLISIVALVGMIGIGWANLSAQVNEIPVIKTRVDELEKDARKLDVIANDVQWIKEEMQRRRSGDSHGAP
jgi:hypothetical protein